MIHNMALPCIEVARFVVTDAYTADPTIVHPTLKILSKLDAVKWIYHGLDSKDNKTWYLLVGWDTLADHQRFIADEAAYTALKVALSYFTSSMIDLTHTHIKHDPTGALSGRFTEVGYATAKPTYTREAVQERVEALRQRLLVVGSEAGVRLPAWGPAVENDRQVIVLVGRDSTELPTALLAGDPLLAQEYADFGAAVDFELNFPALTRYISQ